MSESQSQNNSIVEEGTEGTMMMGSTVMDKLIDEEKGLEPRRLSSEENALHDSSRVLETEREELLEENRIRGPDIEMLGQQLSREEELQRAADEMGITVQLLKEIQGIAYDLPPNLREIEDNQDMIRPLLNSNTQSKFECPVCYEEVERSEVVSLKCGHEFCKECVKEHITSQIDGGKAIAIKCMQDQCPERYGVEQVKPFITEEQLKVYETINQDVLVGKNKNLKWCATPDCGAVIKRPGCCCKRQALCTNCGENTCFKCGQVWHTDKCKVDPMLDPTIAKYLLIAECKKCHAPITKNGACNHMTCSRCNYEFCWICRQDYRGHKSAKPNNVSFVLGCEILTGDTAPAWLCWMMFLLLFSPLHILGELGMGFGYLLHKVFMEEVVREKDESDFKERAIGISLSTLGLSLLPFLLVAFAVVYPIVLICRIYQILKTFFSNVAGQCFRKIFCCCCY